MSYFFRHIDMLLSVEKKSKKSSLRDVIYNLDEFHIIQRVGHRITATSNEKSIIIAICKTEVGAAYIMDCIYDRKPVDLNLLVRIENKSELIPNS